MRGNAEQATLSAERQAEDTASVGEAIFEVAKARGRRDRERRARAETACCGDAKRTTRRARVPTSSPRRSRPPTASPPARSTRGGGAAGPWTG